MEVGRRTLMGLAATASCLAALSGPAAALPPAVGAPPRFAAPVELSPGGFASGVVAGDFNGDGRPDVAATNQADDTVTQWLRSDTGAFVRQTPNIAVGDSPVWIVTGDFNADGRDDAAVGNAGQFSAPADDSVSILLGSASGLVPSQTVTVRDQPEQLTPGDVDGDGDIDLVVANWGPGPQPMSLLRNDGAGRFAATDVSTGCPTGPASASIGEFTGDGRADIAVVCRNDAIVRILGADGSGGFVQPASGQTSCGSGGATDVAAADFDRDGALDLVVACGQARISLQTAGDGFAARPGPTGDSWFNLAGQSFAASIAAADLNGDGLSDALAATPVTAPQPSNLVVVADGDGTGGFAPVNNNRVGTGYPAGGSVNDAVSLDMNEDGKPDIVVASDGAPRVLFNETPIPGVTTGDAVALGPETATLTGAVNASGVDTTYAFQYGTTPAYGRQTPELPSGGVLAGGANHDVSAVLSGLAPATTYHYRLRATNGNGTTYGADRTFRTAPAPPATPPAVQPVAAPSTAGEPRISGSPLSRRVLTCAPGAWSGAPSFAISWLRNGTRIASGGTYTVTRADAGTALQCRVAASNAGGTTVATSAPVVAKLAPCVVPKLSGLTLGRARNALTAAGCRLGKVTRARARVRKGRVIRSSPGRGKILAPDARVNLVVSR